MFREVKKSPWKLSLQLLCVLVAALLVWGCGGGGGSSYDTPTTTSNPPLAGAATNVLIEPSTLKAWMDDGLVNDQGFDNVVILNITTLAHYQDGHIPGAGWWDYSTELMVSGREEGLALDDGMVAPGPVLDEMLQRNGIDCDTTIVLTYDAADNYYFGTRAYFTLRYWGFPKEKIKLLNGGDKAWQAAIDADPADDFDSSYALTTAAPTVEPSDFSVKDNGVLRDDLRYSIGEMIQVVDANNASVTATGEPEINIIQATTGTPALATAIARNYVSFTVEASATGGTFDVATARDTLLNTGTGIFYEELPTIVHCGSGRTCTPIFFALDAILGLNAAVFDGSTNQWNVYRGDPAGGDLYINDAWNVNLNGRSTSTATVNANRGGVATDPTYDPTTGDLYDYIIPANNALFQSLDDPRANQLENEDLDYMGSDSGAPTSATGSSDGC